MNYNIKKVTFKEAQKDKFEDDWRKRDWNKPIYIKKQEKIRDIIRDKEDPDWNKKRVQKKKNKLPDEIKYTKEQINSMKLKSLNRIKIKKDDLYKNVDRNKHYMREGFKSIQEINNIIAENKQKRASEASATIDQSKKLPIIEITEKEIPFEIDPKIFESSEDSEESKHVPSTEEQTSKKSLSTKELIDSIVKKLDVDIATYTSYIVSNDDQFLEQNKTLTNIIKVLKKLKASFETASFVTKYSWESSATKEETKEKDIIKDESKQSDSNQNLSIKKDKQIKLPKGSKNRKNYLRIVIHKALVEDRPIDFDELYSIFSCSE